MDIQTYEDLADSQRKLLDAAGEAMKRAYAKYSNFKVGAAVLTVNNKIYTGTNVENVSYGATICAERTAIFKAVSEGETNFDAIAVIGSSDNVVTPCGCCRQVIMEFAIMHKKNITVIMSNKDKSKIIISNIEELLPLTFKF